MDLAGTVLVTLDLTLSSSDPAVIANFVLTGELGVGWFLALVPGQLDGLANVFLFIFEVFLKIWY